MPNGYHPKPSRWLSIGSISTGTLRTEDLLDAFLSAAENLKLTRQERATVRGVRKRYEEEQDSEEAGYDLEEVTTILENHAPDFCYFGTLEGDGANFGCWPSWDAIDYAAHDGTLARSSALPADGGVGHYLDVNDHGNATLYRRAGNRWVEVWSVV